MDLWVKKSMQDGDDDIDIVLIAKAVVGGGRKGNEVLVSSHSVVVVVMVMVMVMFMCPLRVRDLASALGVTQQASGISSSMILYTFEITYLRYF